MTGRKAQCKAFPECENEPGADGYCSVHPRRRRKVAMTPGELREYGINVAVSCGGTVVPPNKLAEEDETFREARRGAK